ncbi:MAG: hypothetical protein H6772_00505 [Pseudomonadales bacterium]|nr:hypothetical protein [Pseudomonadales bacterium]
MKVFKKILATFFVWRVALFIVGYFADLFLKYDPSFPYADGTLSFLKFPRWVYSWGNFDGVHYLTIAKSGFKGAEYIQAFFPVYPFFAKFLNIFIENILASHLLISNVSFLILLFVWHQLISGKIGVKNVYEKSNDKKYAKKIAWYSVLALILFPTSLFFGAIYTESLFLLTVLLAFIFTQKKQYWLAAIFVAIASATKIIGIALVPALIFEVIFSDQKLPDIFGVKFEQLAIEFKTTLTKKISNWKKYFKPTAIISLGSIGLVLYMVYLWKKFGDPLYFFHVQSEFGGGVRQESLISYPQVLWRYIKILVTARPFDLKYFAYFQEMVAGTLALIVLFLSARKVRLSYVLFALLAFLIPTLTGTFSSMPRYLLVCFPIFIQLAIWAEKSKRFRYVWFTISSILLIVNTLLFIQGYWVA